LLATHLGVELDGGAEGLSAGAPFPGFEQRVPARELGLGAFVQRRRLRHGRSRLLALAALPVDRALDELRARLDLGRTTDVDSALVGHRRLEGFKQLLLGLVHLLEHGVVVLFPRGLELVQLLPQPLVVRRQRLGHGVKLMHHVRGVPLHQVLDLVEPCPFSSSV
jgi:hypothetical protein